MKSCETIRHLLGEVIDGELSVHRHQEVESHLQQCAACADDLQELQQLDRQLADVLVSEGLEHQVARISAAYQLAQRNRPRMAGPDKNQYWAAVATAIAASLFLAFLFRSLPAPKSIPIRIAARLVSATGPVEILTAGTQNWQTVVPPNSWEIPNGARVRTVDATLCEIRTENEGKVRMDRDSEIVINNAQKLELVSGKLWCSAPDDSALEVNLPIQASKLPVMAAFHCPSKSTVQCESKPSSVSCSTPADTNSKEFAEVQVGRETWQISPGQTVSIDGLQRMTRQARDEFDDVWQLPLLALSADAKSELRSTLQKLLAPIGRSKARHRNDAQIRALGPAGAIPLLSFVLQEKDQINQQLRRTAMQLASETADASAIPLLRQLTSDTDPFIASRAISLLESLAKI